jgi:hypothetical protein
MECVKLGILGNPGKHVAPDTADSAQESITIMGNMRRSLLGIEQLEDRRLCAGNVTATFSGGDLNINGDRLANCISVESAGAGTIQVRGFGTHVNGAWNGIKYFNGVTGGVFIRLGDGDDLVRVTNVILPGRLLIDLGWGDDEAVTGHDQTGGDARFANTPTGHLAIYGEFDVYGRKGDDLLYQSYVHAKKVAKIDLGEGNDKLLMRRSPQENLDMQYRGDLSIATGPGQDVVDIDGFLAQANMTMSDDSGSAQLIFRNLAVQGAFYAGLGTGYDRIDFAGVQMNSLTLHGGGGNDVFRIKDTHAVDALFAGDQGSDTFQTWLSHPNYFSSLQRTSIENTSSL